MTYTDKEHYDLLIQLTETDSEFFYAEQILDNKVYHIFNYRLASYESFMNPKVADSYIALSARGIMFDVTDKENIKISSRPMNKFFNIEQGEVDRSNMKLVGYMDKLDGSLISTYLHNGELKLKTKGSIKSEQAVAAMEWLDLPENSEMKNFLKFHASKNNLTVNMEWTAPDNQIVLFYPDASLRILNMVNNENGKILTAENIDKENLVNKDIFVKSHKIPNMSLDNIIESIRNEQGNEGYILEFSDSEGNSHLVKVKNIWYVNLHQIKSNLNTTSKIIETIIDETSDDVRVLFAEDKHFLDNITRLENIVSPRISKIEADVEKFYSDNKELSRKDYAIKAQSELQPYMSLAMNLYIGKETNYKEFFKKQIDKIFSDII
jgi:T4 RnlA family RNA ligase